MRNRNKITLITTVNLLLIVHRLYCIDNLNQIRGVVLDAQNNSPLIGANVILEGTLKGSATDYLGYFNIKQIPDGIYNLIVRMMGYESEHLTNIPIDSSRNKILEFHLKPTVLLVNSIKCESKEIQENLDQLYPSIQVIKPREGHRTSGLERDIFKSIAGLPGISVPSDFSSELSIRGGSPDQNLIMLDNMIIPFPYHFGGLTSTFNSEMVDKVVLHSGGFSAQYGNKMSSVLEIQTCQGNQDEMEFNLSSNMILSTAIVNTPLKGVGSLIFSARKSHFEYIMKSINTDTYYTYPNFYDIQGKWFFQFTPNQKVSVNYLKSHEIVEKMILLSNNQHSETPSLYNRFDFQVMGLNWKSVWSPRCYSEMTFYQGNVYKDIKLSHWYARIKPAYSVFRNDWTVEINRYHKIMKGSSIKIKVMENVRESNCSSKRRVPNILMVGLDTHTRCPINGKKGI